MKLIKLFLILSTLSPGALFPAYGMREEEETAANPRAESRNTDELRSTAETSAVKRSPRDQMAEIVSAFFLNHDRKEGGDKKRTSVIDADKIASFFPRQVKRSVLAFVVKRQYLPDVGSKGKELEEKARNHRGLVLWAKKALNPEDDADSLIDSLIDYILGRKYVWELIKGKKPAKTGDAKKFINLLVETYYFGEKPEEGKGAYIAQKEEIIEHISRLAQNEWEKDLSVDKLKKIPQDTPPILLALYDLVLASLRCRIVDVDLESQPTNTGIPLTKYKEEYEEKFVASVPKFKEAFEAYIKRFIKRSIFDVD